MNRVDKSNNTNRQSLKESAASTARRKRNISRRELSSKIRKEKRSLTVQLKRRTAASTNAGRSSDHGHGHGVMELEIDTQGDPLRAIWNFVSSCPSVPLPTSTTSAECIAVPNTESVLKLQTFIASCPPIALTSEDHVDRAHKFTTLIGHILRMTLDHSNVEASLAAPRIITNLAAMESPSLSEDLQGSYYGKPKPSWCNILLDTVVPQLLQAITRFYHNTTNTFSAPNSTTQTNIHVDSMVTSQCCWAIGNLAGDGQITRNQLITKGAVSPIVQTLRWATRSLHPNTTNMGGDGIYLDLSRNAAWALSNLARGADTSAQSFLHLSQPPALSIHQSGSEDTLLCADDFLMILTNPTQNTSHPSNDLTKDNNVTYNDLLIETMWLLTFLTAKEDTAVQTLFQPSPIATQLCNTLVNCLQQATDMLTNQISTVCPTVTPLTQRQDAMKRIIPLIRTIGNIATASNGMYVPLLLTTPSSLPMILSRWMAAVSTPSNLYTNSSTLSEVSTVATEAAWVIGTLTCDAGFEGHLSTTQAARILLPALTRVLVADVKGTSSSSGGIVVIKSELKRECLAALWNTVSEPPRPLREEDGGMTEDDVPSSDTTVVRDQMLVALAETPGLITSLLVAVSSHDVDAVLPALSVIDALHRRLGRVVQKEFEEGDCADVLEGVCDRATIGSEYGGGKDWKCGGKRMIDRCADLAADLIDDYYADEDEDDGMVMDGIGFWKGDGGGGDGSNPLPRFEFGVPDTEVNSFGTTGVAGPVPPLGRGRGRGSVVPAWMQQQSR